MAYRQTKTTRFETYGEAADFVKTLNPTEHEKQNAAKLRTKVRIRRRPAGHFDVVEFREVKEKETDDGR